MMNTYIKLALWIILYLAVSFGIGQLTQGSISGWYQDLDKPSFNPPNWIFPVMWSFLYITIAIAGWKLWEVKANRTLKGLFIMYTLLNWAWTPIFFGLNALAFGFVWIAAINLINIIFIVKAWQPNRFSAYFMIPVLLWTLFAAVLNYSIWILNAA